MASCKMSQEWFIFYLTWSSRLWSVFIISINGRVSIRILEYLVCNIGNDYHLYALWNECNSNFSIFMKTKHSVQKSTNNESCMGVHVTNISFHSLISSYFLCLHTPLRHVRVPESCKLHNYWLSHNYCYITESVPINHSAGHPYMPG